jgi:diacylglycerol kinase family enzyme
VFVLLNATAEKGRGVRARVQNVLAERGVACVVVEAVDGARLTALALRARADGHRTIVAGGGDGTLNAVASALVGSDTVLGILPLGTYNHFAKDVGIPLQLDGALGVIARGNVREVDVGQVNDRIFLNNSSIGLYPHFAELRDKQRRILGTSKRVAFRRAIVRTYRRFPSLRVAVDAPGGRIVATTRAVFVGNNIYAIAGRLIGSRARLDEGVLCVFVTPHMTRARFAAAGFAALVGRRPREDELRALTVSEVWIHTEQHKPRVALDGEVCRLRAPLHYRVRPRALLVHV